MVKTKKIKFAIRVIHMPNGIPGDSPITDTVINGGHPFPPDLEDLVIKLHNFDPQIFNLLEWEPFNWEEGKYLNEAKELLTGLIENYGDPDSYKRLIAQYTQKIRSA